jgi:hypothetical protein
MSLSDYRGVQQSQTCSFRVTSLTQLHFPYQIDRKEKQLWYALFSCSASFEFLCCRTLTNQWPPCLLQMDVIAGYKTGGLIVGDILIDGFRKDERVWKKISGYAEQVSLASH